MSQISKALPIRPQVFTAGTVIHEGFTEALILDSVCTGVRVSPKSTLLRYTPPPSELHLHLINDVDPPAEFSGRKMQGAVPESVDVDMGDGTSSSTQDKAASTPSKDSGETLKTVNNGATPKNEVKLILKVIAAQSAKWTN